MIGSIETYDIDGKVFEIKRVGVTLCLELQSIFMELVSKARIPQDEDITDAEMGMMLMKGMRGNLLKDLKNIIVKCVHSPMLAVSDGRDLYEELDPRIIPNLFMKIYYLNVGQHDNKKKEQ